MDNPVEPTEPEDALEQLAGEMLDETEEVEEEFQDDEESEEVDSDEESEEQDPDEDEEAHSYESVDELAEAMGVEGKELLSMLKVNATVNGESESISLQDAISGYQRQSDYTRGTQALSEERKTFEGEITQARQSVDDQAMVLGQILHDAQQVLLGEVNSEEMQRLQYEDPATYSTRRLAMQDRQNQLNGYMQNAAHQFRANKDSIDTAAATQQAQYVEAEQKALSTAMPDWNTEKAKALAGYLVDQGYTQDQLRGLVHHRDVLMAEKARQWDELQAKGGVAKKKVKFAPKFQKKSGVKTTAKTGRKTSLKQQLRKSNNVSDAANLIESMLE